MHSSTTVTPFEALYGFAPFKLLAYIPGTLVNPLVEKQLKSKDELWGFFKENLQKAQQRMKYFANQKRTERHFAMGD